MTIFNSFLTVLQVVSALAVIGLVLMQHGKGADMGAAFGSGSAGSLFGSSGSATFLSRLTAVCATIFLACTLGLSFYANSASSGGSGSVVREIPVVPESGSAQDEMTAPAPAEKSDPVQEIPE